MSELIRIAGPTAEPRATLLLVHGLGGHACDTWRRGTDPNGSASDKTFWPLWLARDCENLAVYSIGYDTPVSRLRGTAVHFTDQANNIFERILAEPALAKGPLILIGHSLGGLLIKQLLRTAESTSRYRVDAANLLDRVEKIAFLATPHSGSGLATWGDRLRILIRPSAATASLVRNDPSLRDLNNWYRDWANGRGVAHLILIETVPARVLGMIVQPDSADPGLANVRSGAIGADHIAICKPVDDASDIYVFVRDFINVVVERPKQPFETKLPDAIISKLVVTLDARGDTARAVDAGVERRTVVELARRLRPDEVLDFDQAVKELSVAVEVAIAVTEKAARGTNFDNLVDAVLKTIAQKTRAGDLDGAAKDADDGFAKWERGEAECRENSLRSGIALLEAGLEQEILRRDAVAAARRLEKIVSLEHPADSAARFAALRSLQQKFYVRGGTRGSNFDLQIAIEIGRILVAIARNPDERGRALNRLGVALRALGERETGSDRLEEAAATFREALKERTRERVPLQWAGTQSNLGIVLAQLGERGGGAPKLAQAADAFRNALTVTTRQRVPLNWARVQNNLANVLARLGEREANRTLLIEAAAAYQEILKEWTRERAPLEWAMTQTNLGNALRLLAEREHGTS